VFETTRLGGWESPAEPIPAPLALFGTTVPAAWVDYNGHMSEWCYLLAMGENSDAFFRYIGINEEYRTSGGSLYTVETHLRNLREAALGDSVSLRLRVLGLDAKRVHIAHEMYSGEMLLATGEQLLLHVNMAAGRATALPTVLHDRLAQIATAHNALPVPEWVGCVINIPS
jgi:acyl-CoA thioester hydrolase